MAIGHARMSPITLPVDRASPATPDGGIGAAERQLLAAAERVARQPLGCVVVVLHLARLHPAALRPHHRRIARAVMQDAALRQDGPIFFLRNGDVVLFGRYGQHVSATTTLVATLASLFRFEAAEPSTLISVWPLIQDAGPLLDYAVARFGETEVTVPATDVAAPSPRVVDAVVEVIGTPRSPELLQRQTAVLVGPAGSFRADSLRPLYQELTFSLALLEAAIAAPGQLTRDQALLGHLAGHLDRRTLTILREALGRGGALDPTAMSKAPLHLNLTLPTLLSDEFAGFAALCRTGGCRLGVEVALPEAAADPTQFARARDLADQMDVALVLDGVSHTAMLIACPWQLQAGLLKLEWSARLPELPQPDRVDLAEAIGQADPARVILHGADSEAAIRWGMAHGIRRFQGRHIDQILAAARIVGCSVSAACSLRQCVERAATPGGAVRAGCRNHALLDAGLPISGLPDPIRASAEPTR
jgi:hypothetical protein